MPEYESFQGTMGEIGSSAAVLAAGRLSDELHDSVNQAATAWQNLKAGWTRQTDERDRQIDFEAIEEFQSIFLNSQIVLERFVHTQERALSVLLYCLGATVILVIGILAIVEVENERDRRAARRTQLLAQNTLGIQERERARIARALHDSLAQELSLATLEAELIAGSISRSDAETTGISEKLNARLRRSIDWVRTLAYELRPAEIDNVGLGAAISTFCEERAAENRLRFTWHVSDKGENLATEKAINIYRIVQESVTNAMRHSRADELILDLKMGVRKIELTVADNGIGMHRDRSQVNGTHHGLGIAGMQERARMLGATMHIDSSAGRGTTIRLTVPVDRPMKPQESL
jgi:signal transduction histidine kinase